MDLKVFDGQEKSELSMIEVAHAILAYHNEAMAFADLTNEIQQYLGKSDEEIRERLSQFYTDLNVDGSFISLGDNTWGLRAWYPYESIDEATVGETEDEEDRPKKRRRKVNAFLAGTDDDDDVIDYDNDDPEDEIWMMIKVQTMTTITKKTTTMRITPLKMMTRKPTSKINCLSFTATNSATMKKRTKKIKKTTRNNCFNNCLD